jgi:nucleoside-diphosphate-sugar epimerase
MIPYTGCHQLLIKLSFAFRAALRRISLMQLLIAGNGYLGAEVGNRALAQGWMVERCSLSGHEGTHACDLGDAASVDQLRQVIAPPDAIVHCASSGKGGAPAYQHVYFQGVKNLQQAFPHSLILFTSSSSVYGQTDGSIVTEISDAEPDRETGKILRATEEQTTAHGGIVCRLSGIYGPARSVILRKFLQGDAIIEEDGRRFLNQIHRDDAARAILHLLGLALTENHAQSICGEIFNTSDTHPLSQLATYQGLADFFLRPLPPSGPRDLDRKRGWTHKQVSNEKLRATGWQPAYPSFLTAVPHIAPSVL